MGAGLSPGYAGRYRLGQVFLIERAFDDHHDDRPIRLRGGLGRFLVIAVLVQDREAEHHRGDGAEHLRDDAAQK